MYLQNPIHRGANPIWHEAATPRIAIRPIQHALDREQWLLWAVALFPLCAMILIVALKMVKPGMFMILNREDGFVEWATAIVYVGGSGFAASLALHFRRQKETLHAVLYAGLAIGMIFIAMEEISWGQRLLGIDTPDYIAQRNLQDELTFHNIDGFPLHAAYIAVGLYGAFSRMIAQPVLGRRYPDLVNLLTPPRALFLFFFIPALLYGYYEFIWYTDLVPRGVEWSEYWAETPRFLIPGDQESIELLLSLGFLLFTVLNWVRYRVGAPLTLGR
jgi:hypothetical protein